MLFHSPSSRTSSRLRWSTMISSIRSLCLRSDVYAVTLVFEENARDNCIDTVFYTCSKNDHVILPALEYELPRSPAVIKKLSTLFQSMKSTCLKLCGYSNDLCSPFFCKKRKRVDPIVTSNCSRMSKILEHLESHPRLAKRHKYYQCNRMMPYSKKRLPYTGSETVRKADIIITPHNTKAWDMWFIALVFFTNKLGG